MDFESRIARIYDHLYGNAGVRTPGAIGDELGKLLRTALFVESQGRVPAFPLEPAEVRAGFDAMRRAWGLPGGGEGIRLSDADLRFCGRELAGLRLGESGRDVCGDALELVRASWAKQRSGQFFTDARVARLAMELLELDALAGDDLVDICCGTGGFLLAALDRIRGALPRGASADADRAAALAAGAVRGQEVDPEIAEVAAASLAWRLGARAAGLVRCGDSLAPGAFGRAGAGADAGPDLGAGAIREGSHRCAASNPPFGTKITVKDPAVLAGLELARGGRPEGRPRPRAPDVLLLEQNVRILRPGEGRLAIVLPYQIVSGPQCRDVRAWLLRHARLEAVVDLPAETFQPHTGTKTSLVLVRRRARPLERVAPDEDGPVFLATPRWIGHDRRGRPLARAEGGGVLSDIEDVGRAWAAFRAGGDPGAVHPRSFTVDRRRVAADPLLRLNARFHAGAGGATTGGEDAGAGGEDAGAGGETPAARGRFRLAPLGSLCERVFFPPRFKRHYVDPAPGAVPFLGGANIGQLLPRIDKWLAADDPHLVDLIVRAGWILVTRSGTTGVVSTVPPAWDGVAMSEHVIRVVPRRGAVDPAWLQAVLRSQLGQRALARGIYGSVIDEITPDFVAGIPIPLPRRAGGVAAAVAGRIARAERARQRAIAEYEAALRAVDEALGAPPARRR